MRLTIQHRTRYRYETAPSQVVNVLRLTPCSSASQSVRDWRIDVTGDASLHRSDDAFGNIVHTYTLDDPGEEIVVTAMGTVATEPSNGVVSGTREKLPLGVFLRQTELTGATPELVAFAQEVARSADGSALDIAHKLNLALNDRMTFERDSTNVATSAAEAFAAGRGVCQDLTHVLLALARTLGIPARYISGYQFIDEQARDAHAGHAWGELHVEDLGWVGFDPAAGQSIDDSYVRVAVGLDTMGASPVRGATYGGAGERLEVAVTMDRAGRPSVPPSGTQTQGRGGQSQTLDQAAASSTQRQERDGASLGQSQSQSQGQSQGQSQNMAGPARSGGAPQRPS